METYGKAFGKRVACDNLKAKKKKKIVPTKPIAPEKVRKWDVSGLCLLAAYSNILEKWDELMQ